MVKLRLRNALLHPRIVVTGVGVVSSQGRTAVALITSAIEAKTYTMIQSKPDLQVSCSPSSAHRLSTNQTVSIIGARVIGRGIAAAAVRAGMMVRISDSNSMAASAAV